MTPQREKELEQLLHRLRQRAFESDKAAALIPKVKARLMPAWDQRVAELAHRHSERMLRLWA